MLIGITFLLWLPLIILSLPISTVSNPPIVIKTTLSIDNFEPLFYQNTEKGSIVQLNSNDLKVLREKNRSIFSKSSSKSEYQNVTLESVSKFFSKKFLKKYK